MCISFLDNDDLMNWKAEHGSSALINAIVNAMPMGFSVQDAQGRLLVLNEQAALAIGEDIARLRGNMPFGVRQAGPERIARRRERFLRRLAGHPERLHERAVIIDGKPRTLLVTDWPVQVGGQKLLVCTSIDITERKRFEQELELLAFYDQLTGLPNRTLIQKRVDAALIERAGEGMFALAFIDLDNFKNINDYYGHAIGDELLCAVAGRIAGQMRACDTLARISGDEFLLLINPLEDPQSLPLLMDRIVGAMKEPFFIEGRQVLASATIGTSIFPLHGQSYDTLQRCADTAMYYAKSHRKGSTCGFDSVMSDAIVRLDMEQRLRNAVRGRHFRTYLQPKVAIRTGKIVGFEALVRWIEADREVLGPDDFIALATEIGLIDAITHFVLEDVADFLPRLQSRFGENISISINIAARQASDILFMTSLMDYLQAQGIAASVILELTEDALVAAQIFQNRVLPHLREMGVRVSIDDFGTGFSSLSKLADITADEIKVDRTFISSIHEQPRNQCILKAIESLCQALRIEVVVEGVETAEELAYLERFTSIQFVQGYYFGRPQSVESIFEAGPIITGNYSSE